MNKRVLLVDDEPDVNLAVKIVLEENGFQVNTFTDPFLALQNFRKEAGMCDLLILDIQMPDMNGFELCTEILKIDVNVKICFMSSGEVNHEAVRELYPTISIGCFIKKPIAINYLVKRIKAELE